MRNLLSKLYTVHRTLYTNQSGQAFILAIGILVIIIITTMVLITGAYTYSTSAKYTVDSMQATQLAEAGIDRAVAALNKSAGTYNGENETALGSGVYSVSVTSKNNSTFLVQSTGYVPNKTNPKSKRTISIEISKGTGISFVYGMLMGNGGITMGNGSAIHGAIYSNGNIIGGNNEVIDGDVFVAGGTQAAADQQNSCSGINCTDFVFGKNVSGQNQLDVAQSFRLSTTAVINKVTLRLKKVGSPPNLTVRILGDNSGKPNKNNVLTSGTLAANLVTTQYPAEGSGVDITFSTTPTLTANTPYWIVLDTSSNNSNYWSWAQDLLQGYTSGGASWSPDWQANGNPTWTAITGDLDFKVWTGGVATSITMNNGSVIGGNAHANTISGVTINRDAYYQSISNSTVLGTSHPGSSDPPPMPMPISEANIAEWQQDAQLYGVQTGNITGCPATLGPGKIIGNITTTNNCTITVTTPIWLTGNMTNGNAVIYRMNPSLGSSSGVIIVDGQTTFSNSDDLLGTGETGSYLTLLSNYDSVLNSGAVAVDTGNSSITGILYAPKGKINLANNANFKEVVAYQINMGTGTILTYDSGLISTFFSAGPSGSFSVVKGSYQEK